MELEGLRRCLAYLQEHHSLRPDAIVTDRHASVQKWLREEFGGVIQHYYDVFHVAKGEIFLLTQNIVQSLLLD